MWDTTVPPFVDQLRTDLVSLAAIISEINDAGHESDHVHYPRINLSGEQGGTPDALPAFLLGQTNGGISAPAEGAPGLPTGMALTIDVYLPATSNGGTARTLGYTETFCQTIVTQLVTKYPRIIPFSGPATFEEGSDPTPGAFAGDESGRPTAFHHIRIRIPCGYQF